MPKTGINVLSLNNRKILFLPCETYNFSPQNQSPVPAEIRDKKILHFKGRLKRRMPLYWQSWVSHQGKNSPPASPGLLLSFRRLTHRLKSAPALKKLIRRQRILIVGSGPSAESIKNIPPDVKIFTCNAGLKILLDKGLGSRIDLLFIVRSKKSKEILVEGKATSKMQLIESLAQKSHIQILATNDKNYVLHQKAYQGRYSHLLWDDGRDPHYLEKLIHPDTAQDIQGHSSVPATSCGLRLLQYALYYQAKEIYLAGIDFGRDGYCWGPNPNPWKHDDIDENFLQRVSMRYKNIFSLSKTSPALHYLPWRELDTTTPLPHDCDKQNKKIWVERAGAAAALWLEYNRSSGRSPQVADFGCGNEKLKSILARKLGQDFTYNSFDKFPQTSSAAYWDLEQTLPSGPFDVVFCLGLLEYLHSLPAFLSQLAQITSQAVISYTISDSHVYTPTQVQEKGWLSHHSASEMENLFKRDWNILSRVTIDNGKTAVWLLDKKIPLETP